MNDQCKSSDCPYHTGGECWINIASADKATTRELRALRNVYRQFQHDGLDIISAAGWRMIIEPVTDRIKSLTQGSEI